jgi:hypothetical protein
VRKKALAHTVHTFSWTGRWNEHCQSELSSCRVPAPERDTP